MENHGCQCRCDTSSVEQSLDEIKFEQSIFNACVQGDLERVKYLINKNGPAIVKEQDKNGYSCLHYSARNTHFELCKLLINYGIDLNLKTNSCKSTALHRAAYIGNMQIVKLLLENKANPFEKDCDGKNALHKSVEQFLTSNQKSKAKHIDTIRFLFQFNRDLLNQTDNFNKKPTDYFDDELKDLFKNKLF